jgi:hypothetical protein
MQSCGWVGCAHRWARTGAGGGREGCGFTPVPARLSRVMAGCKMGLLIHNVAMVGVAGAVIAACGIE